MRQPDRSGPKGRTLYDIAAERSALLKQGQPFDAKHSDGIARDESGNILLPASAPPQESPIGAFGEAFFLTTSLCMLHFTLDVLVYHQYAQSIEWGAIVSRTFKIAPVLLTAIYLLHTPTARSFEIVRQMFYFGVAVGAGCYMITVGNQGGYFAVMKQAPPLGTLWIWSVVEMGLGWALASMVVNTGWLLWNGYSMF